MPVAGDAAVQQMLHEWLPYWTDPERTGGDEDPRNWPNAPHFMPRPTAFELKKLAGKYKEHAGLGWEQLHPRCIQHLADEDIERFIDILLAWEADPQAYVDWLTNVIFRAKPEGGRRPIGITFIFVRLWSALRGREARAWERRNAEKFHE